MKDITLYTKLDCHLCEEAHQILLGLIYDIPMKINVVDITQSDNNLTQEKYGIRIPVLTQPDRSEELDWPFTTKDIRVYLAD